MLFYILFLNILGKPDKIVHKEVSPVSGRLVESAEDRWSYTENNQYIYIFHLISTLRKI